MWISQGHGGEPNLRTVDANDFVEDFAVRPGKGQVAAAEGGSAHFRPDTLSIILDLARDLAARRMHIERFVPDALEIPQVARENAGSIPAFLGFGSVRIENTQVMRGIWRDPAHQDAIAAKSPVPIADPLDKFGGHPPLGV
jgi:hypothetical protein